MKRLLEELLINYSFPIKDTILEKLVGIEWIRS
jgi:hypothetical protein